MKSDNPYIEELEGMLTFHIHYIADIIDGLGREMMREKKMPIDLDQLPVLMCVFLSENLTQMQTASFVGRDKSSVKRTLSIFQKKGLIKIIPHPDDKRKTIVQITDVGNYVADQVKQMIHEAEDKIFSFLTKKAKKELLQSLKNITEKIEPKSCIDF